MKILALPVCVIFCAALAAAEDCGDYDPSIYICCNGVLNVRPGEGATCCSTKAFNPDDSICCNSIINPRPQGTPACCQSMAHDSENYICCQGTSNPRPGENSACCRIFAIDTDIQVCCNGVPNVRYENNGCCGTTSFDRDVSRCCNDETIIPIEDDCPPVVDPQAAAGITAKKDQKVQIPENALLKDADAPYVPPGWVRMQKKRREQGIRQKKQKKH